MSYSMRPIGRLACWYKPCPKDPTHHLRDHTGIFIGNYCLEHARKKVAELEAYEEAIAEASRPKHA